MTEVVLHASLLVAYVSPTEIHHGVARAMLDGLTLDRVFVVPPVFRLEVVSALARRGTPDEKIDVVDALLRSAEFRVASLDAAAVDRAIEVARRARLRAYDALYGALALEVGLELFTLDAELATRLLGAYPAARLRTEGTG